MPQFSPLLLQRLKHFYLAPPRPMLVDMSSKNRLNPNVPDIHRPFTASTDRYRADNSRQVGTSGMFLPPISLGLWWNFGDNIPLDN